MDFIAVNSFLDSKKNISIPIEDASFELSDLCFTQNESENGIEFNIDLFFKYMNNSPEKKVSIKLEMISFKLRIDFTNQKLTLEGIDKKQLRQIFNFSYPLFKYFIYRIVASFMRTYTNGLDLSEYVQLQSFPSQAKVTKVKSDYIFEFSSTDEKYAEYLLSKVNFAVFLLTFFEGLARSSYKQIEES